nr:hypothetical protein [Phyllobacterium sophorae]
MQPPQGHTQLVDAFGFTAACGGVKIGQYLLLTGRQQFGNLLNDAVVAAKIRRTSLHRRRIGFALGSQPQLRDIHQAEAELVKRSSLALFQFKFDFRHRLSLDSGFYHTLVEGDFDPAIRHIDDNCVPADPGDKVGTSSWTAI